MNTYKFSAKTVSFYPVALLDDYRSAGTLPDDLIDIADEFYIAPPEGKFLTVDKAGMPLWAEKPAPTEEQYQNSAEAKRQQLLTHAESEILPLSRAVKYQMATDREAALFIEWEKYTVLLNRIDLSKAPDIEWPVLPTEE